MGPANKQPTDPCWVGHIKIAPAQEVAPYVDYYWLTRWDRRRRTAHTAATLLEPCVHLQLVHGCAEILGVVRGVYRMRIEGRGWVIGARFRPGGFYPFVLTPVAHWTDRAVAAQEIFTAHADQAGWEAPLKDAANRWRDGPDEVVPAIRDHLDQVLRALLVRRDLVAEEMARLCQMAAGGEMRRVADLAQAGGCSERTLYRLFVRYVGVSPAWVLRRYRVHAAAERLTRGQATRIPELAYELGYSDQAHLTRDFRDTVGVTPAAYVRSLR